MSRVARDRASRLREFTDLDQEFRETKDSDAAMRRHRAMRRGSPEDFARAGEKLAGSAAQEGRDSRQKLRDMDFKVRRK